MASIVYLTTLSPSTLGPQLEQAGHRVWEALSVSEVLYLLENNDIDVIVIGPDVEDPEMAEIHLKRACIKLQPGFKISDLIWELSALSGSPPTQIQ